MSDRLIPIRRVRIIAAFFLFALSARVAVSRPAPRPKIIAATMSVRSLYDFDTIEVDIALSSPAPAKGVWIRVESSNSDVASIVSPIFLSSGTKYLRCFAQVYPPDRGWFRIGFAIRRGTQTIRVARLIDADLFL